MVGFSLPARCALRAAELGRRIRTLVHALPIAERARPAEAVLKPERAVTPAVDRLAEQVGLECLEQLADEIGHRIELVVDPAHGSIISLGRSTGRAVVFASFDAIDGTMKVAGLGNDLAAGRLRIANDGNWGVAAAFTAPTENPLEAVRLGDFVAAAVVDGNPRRYRSHPEEVIAVPDGSGALVAFDVSDAPLVGATLRRAPRVFTSSISALAQAVVYLDGYQAFDLDTRKPGDDRLAGALYRALIDRHGGGAFDIVRQYGNLSALLDVLLGWRGELPWREAQGAGFVVVNENVANLVPALPIVAGAGGLSVDFAGRPLRERRLVDGRSDVIHAANQAVGDALIALVRRARSAVTAG